MICVVQCQLFAQAQHCSPSRMVRMWTTDLRNCDCYRRQRCARWCLVISTASSTCEIRSARFKTIARCLRSVEVEFLSLACKPVIDFRRTHCEIYGDNVKRCRTEAGGMALLQQLQICYALGAACYAWKWLWPWKAEAMWGQLYLTGPRSAEVCDELKLIDEYDV